jgi:hypothetical protein
MSHSIYVKGIKSTIARTQGLSFPIQAEHSPLNSSFETVMKESENSMAMAFNEWTDHELLFDKLRNETSLFKNPVLDNDPVFQGLMSRYAQFLREI